MDDSFPSGGQIIESQGGAWVAPEATFPVGKALNGERGIF